MEKEIFAGWLRKQGHVKRNWKRRYFTLNEAKSEEPSCLLEYYTDDSLYTKKGAYTITAASSCNILDGDKLFVLQAKGANGANLLVMEAESNDDRELWFDMIDRTIAQLRDKAGVNF
jgi:hypothetical protein